MGHSAIMGPSIMGPSMGQVVKTTEHKWSVIVLKNLKTKIGWSAKVDGPEVEN